MRTLSTLALVVPLLLVATAYVPGPSTAIDHNPNKCTVTYPELTCRFPCPSSYSGPGSSLQVRTAGSGLVAGEAQCSFSTARCVNLNECHGAWMPPLQATVGTCKLVRLDDTPLGDIFGTIQATCWVGPEDP